MLGIPITIDGFTHVLALLLLVSRLGDVVSTRLVSPRLRLETNPFIRRAGWPLAALGVLVAAVPYVHAPLGVALLAASLLVSASNLSRGWVAHALGEAEFEAILLRAARGGRRRHALAFVLAGGGFVVLAGAVLVWLSETPYAWPYWFGVGIAGYGLVMAVYGAAFVVRIFRRARAAA